MARFGGFLCFMFKSLPGLTEYALYFRVANCQMQNFNTTIFLLYTLILRVF